MEKLLTMYGANISAIVLKSYRKKPILCIDDGVVYDSVSEASEICGISRACITECANGRRKTAGGKRWKYAPLG